MSFKNTSLASFCSPSRAYNVTVFSANPNGPKRGIRRKLTAKDRAKVHAVRLTGACLSCRMLKVPVSFRVRQHWNEDDESAGRRLPQHRLQNALAQCDIPDPENPGPCKRCLAIASRPQQKGLLAFRECIRTKLRDVNIFRHTLDIEFTSLNSAKLKSLVSKTVDPIEPGSSLSLPEIMSSIFTWMVPEKGVGPERSIVGALICSEEFRQLHNNSGFMGGDLLEKFRVLIYSSTLAYVYDSGSREVYDSDLTMRDLHRITHAMGSDLLLYLDNILAPHQLAKMSQAQLSGLFVVIFGIALAVAYSTAVYDSPAFDAGTDTGSQTPKTLWQALQEHLSQMLAHHLVILGARLGLVLRKDSEKEVLSSLMSGIIHRGNFVWVAQQRAVELPDDNNTSTTPSTVGHDALAEATQNTEELFVLNIPEADVRSDPTTGALGLKKLDSYRSTPVSVRSLQTIQNSLRAIVTSEDDKDIRARLTFANKRASARCRARKRKFEATQFSSSGVSTPSKLPKVARDAASIVPTMVSSSNHSGTDPGSSENNTSSFSATSATSTTPASPFLPLSTGLDLDMDLDADPFGIGWLPDPEPRLETEVEALKSASESHSDSTLESEPQPDHGSTSPGGSDNLSVPNLLQRGWYAQEVAPSFYQHPLGPSTWAAQNYIIPPKVRAPTDTTFPSDTGWKPPVLWGVQCATYLPSGLAADAATTWASQQVALPSRRESPKVNNDTTNPVGSTIWGTQPAARRVSPLVQTNTKTSTSPYSDNFASGPAELIWASNYSTDWKAKIERRSTTEVTESTAAAPGRERNLATDRPTAARKEICLKPSYGRRAMLNRPASPKRWNPRVYSRFRARMSRYACAQDQASTSSSSSQSQSQTQSSGSTSSSEKGPEREGSTQPTKLVLAQNSITSLGLGGEDGDADAEDISTDFTKNSYFGPVQKRPVI